MKSLAQLDQELLSLGNLQGLLETYEELAAQELKKVRDQITHNRDFLENLAQLSVKVEADLEQSFGLENKKAAVFLAAEEGLYGDLVEKVFFKFLRFVQAETVPAVVVGRVGQDLMKQWGQDVEYDYFSEKEPAWGELLRQYGQLEVFFGQFENIARQKAQAQTVSGQAVLQVVGAMGERKATKGKRGLIQAATYLYEPSAEKIGAKFSQEIMVTLLAGMAEENRLAKQAARLVQLDEAVDRIDDNLGQLDQARHRRFKKQRDLKQQARAIRLLRR